MNKIVYEVWGEDTFAGETFCVGTYSTRQEADRVCRSHEKSALSQCEELRDTYWVVTRTPELALAREERERKRDEWRRKRSEFNYSHLCELVIRLNKRLLETIEQDKKGDITEKEVDLIEKNEFKENKLAIGGINIDEETSDCYSSITYQYIRNIKKGSCLVYIAIQFKEEGKMESGCFMGTPDQIRKQFSFKQGEKFVCEFIDKMITEFFRS